ncbi:DmsE family decaheme c-type cytochrome [Desulfosediminicola ganghwensis]|uniref:DmsE family decaheme c-type cytochrome n=1 Tax=Desulfosediminicola ganghwensis TaxID=2569540 RepID=UPI0010AB66B9|nr:DmsE family decaheme c-type cytochrome [Desulfosediminicola ganghwensis]
MKQTMERVRLYATLFCALVLLGVNGVAYANGDGGEPLAGQVEETVLIVTEMTTTGYVGDSTCLECHDEMEGHYYKSLHFRAWESTGNTAAGCESCHGPGEVHADDPEPDNIISFSDRDGAEVKVYNETCLNCHVKSEKISMWDMSQHEKYDVACATCHPMHEGYSPIAETPDVCYQCHTRVKVHANLQARHPIREGKVTCKDCHNPHGTHTDGMIEAETLNELCYNCHGDKRGPNFWEHPPVEEDCSTCHAPHGSRHKGMLVQKVPTICNSCHQVVHTPPYGEESGFTGSETPNSRYYARACLNCHQTVHGSMSADRDGSRYRK